MTTDHDSTEEAAVARRLFADPRTSTRVIVTPDETDTDVARRLFGDTTTDTEETL